MQGYTLTESALQEIAEMKRQVSILVDARNRGERGNAIFRNHLAKTGGTAITAANYAVDPDTFGSGTVTLYQRNSDNEFETIKDNDGAAITLTVYNYTDTASGTDAYVWIGQDSLGTWYYLNEAC